MQEKGHVTALKNWSWAILPSSLDCVQDCSSAYKIDSDLTAWWDLCVWSEREGRIPSSHSCKLQRYNTSRSSHRTFSYSMKLAKEGTVSWCPLRLKVGFTAVKWQDLIMLPKSRASSFISRPWMSCFRNKTWPTESNLRPKLKAQQPNISTIMLYGYYGNLQKIVSEGWTYTCYRCVPPVKLAVWPLVEGAVNSTYGMPNCVFGTTNPAVVVLEINATYPSTPPASFSFGTHMYACQSCFPTNIAAFWPKSYIEGNPKLPRHWWT